MPITLISNSLDYVSLETIPPASCHSSNNNNNKEDDMMPQSDLVRLTEKTLNNVLKVHEKGVHSSFASDFHLSRSGQALNMPLFPQLHLACPKCHAHKINKSIP